ncbi:CoA transferase [Caldovatus aquaticus]|uniref:CoA transferase n=1 Tax=Caldovatus aquaticus TaxID=2865671 RepID=A0ABS7F7P7_9PROT|nr:CoA transferase [Caldovatus aquaticus]MBW8270835.1 CoA transferase [Caldovatus aquaticus]
MAPIPPADALAGLWRHTGLPAEALGAATLEGREPVLPSTYAVGTAAQAAIAAAGLAAAEVWRGRTGRAQRVAVAMRHAAAEFRSERHLRLDGTPAPELWDRIAGLYQAGDGRWLRLHTNYPHHRDGVLRLLGCGYDRAAVSAALARWTAEEFEAAAAAAGLVVTMARTTGEWDAHPQGRAVAGLPVLLIERIGEAPPTPFPAGPPRRPLEGVRVLDLTRVIAGPVCGRTLAAHGATVLNVTAAHLPFTPTLVMDTGRGKLAAHLDLRSEAGRAALRGLAAQADVFVQGYRPGAIAGHGFAPEQVAAIRPGIVCVSLSAYGHAGPWAGRRGFDSLVQNANGMNLEEAAAAGETKPRPLPCQALDHASGYLMALGAMAALLRRAREGGSWHVRVSLAATGHWIRSLGRVEGGLACPEQRFEDIADLLEVSDSPFGRLTALRHAAQLEETPPFWALPAVPLGTHAPRWPA